MHSLLRDDGNPFGRGIMRIVSIEAVILLVLRRFIRGIIALFAHRLAGSVAMHELILLPFELNRSC